MLLAACGGSSSSSDAGSGDVTVTMLYRYTLGECTAHKTMTLEHFETVVGPAYSNATVQCLVSQQSLTAFTLDCRTVATPKLPGCDPNACTWQPP